MSSRVRLLLLVLLLCMSGGAYYYLQRFESGDSLQRIPAVAGNTPAAANALAKLDDAVLAQIRSYFEGITVPAGENKLGYAMRLDSAQGRPALRRGDDRSAYGIYRKVLAISYRQGSLQGIGVALGVLAQIEDRMGRRQAAIQLAGLQYAVAQAGGKRFETGVVESYLGGLLGETDPALAVKMKLRALQSLKGTPYAQDYIQLLSALSANSEVSARPAIALYLAKEAWTLAEQSGNSPDMALARSTAAQQYAPLLSAQGKNADAIAVLMRAIASYPAQNRNTPTYYEMLTLLADNYAVLGRPDEARQHYAAAYSYYQHDRLNALGDEARAQLDNDESALINHYIDLLNAGRHHAEALTLLESNKARTLNDISGDVGQRYAYRQLTALKRKQAQQRLALYQAAQNNAGERDIGALLPGAEQRWKRLWADEEALRQRQEREMRELQQSLRIRNLAAGSAFTGSKLSKLQQALRRDEAAIALFAGDSGLGVFLLTGSELHYLSTDLKPLQYRHEVEKLQAALLNPTVDFYREPARLLGDALLKPLLAQLPKRVKRLIYSPDGPFVNLPLGVLTPNGKFLAQDYAILRVPSLGALDASALLAEHGAKGISCVDPAIYGRRLPFQQATGEHLTKLYGLRLKALNGADCSTERLEAALAAVERPAFLHIGAHGRFYAGEAMQSGVLLTGQDTEGQAELWDAHAIAGVDLNPVSLVTLSSCETGLSDQERQRDVFGLLRALLFGGAHQVLAPLWAVQDEATHRLMAAFFDAYKAGHNAADALLQAQNRLLGDKRYAHPFYWSGFVLTGDAL